VRAGAGAVFAAAALALVVTVVLLRDPPELGEAAPPPSPSPPGPTAPPTTDAGTPLTLDGWGSVRIGGPDSALSRALCGTSWCPEPVVEAYVDERTGCVQRVRPAPRPGDVTVWVWSIDGRVEAVGVVGPPDAPQETPLGPRFGVLLGDDGTSRPRGGGPGTSRVEVVDDRIVTLATVQGEFLDYAEVATTAGEACAISAPPPDVQPPDTGEPRIVDRAVEGARVAGPADVLATAGWLDVSFGDATCRTWLSPGGAVAYTRAETVVGISARAVDGVAGVGAIEVGQPVDDVEARLPAASRVLQETLEAQVDTLWDPVFGTLISTGTPTGRVVITTVRPPAVARDVDWPLPVTGSDHLVVSGIVVGESCEEPDIRPG
jgi:hypothetical protein